MWPKQNISQTMIFLKLVHSKKNLGLIFSKCWFDSCGAEAHHSQVEFSRMRSVLLPLDSFAFLCAEQQLLVHNQSNSSNRHSLEICRNEWCINKYMTLAERAAHFIIKKIKLKIHSRFPTQGHNYKIKYKINNKYLSNGVAQIIIEIKWNYNTSMG